MAKFNVIALIIFNIIFSSCLAQSITNSQNEFEINMVNALDLTLVVKDSDFYYSRLQIFHDTLFGTYKRSLTGSAPDEYFIQNLTDTNKLIEFVNYDISYYRPGLFDCYRNACIYMKYGSGMRTLCSNGKLTEYFSQKHDNLNSTGKIILYKNEAILIRQRDITAYDINSQKKIWKYNFPAKGITYSFLKGDSLFFSTWIDSVATVCCYNIQKQSVIWKKRIEEREPNFTPAEYDPSYCLFRDNDALILPGWNSCYALDMNTGNIAGKVPWESFWGNNSRNVLFKVENNFLYIGGLENDLQNTKCIDIATNKTIWEVKDYFFLGLYKNYVIANNKDWSYYVVIDKSTGSIKYKFPASTTKRPRFNFIGDYILINRIAIYR